MSESSEESVDGSQISHKKEIEESKLQFVLENFSQKMPGMKFISPRVELTSVNAVWLTTVSKDSVLRGAQPYDRYTFGLKIQVKSPECSLKHITFIAKGMVDNVEILNPCREYLSINKNGEGEQEFEVLVSSSPALNGESSSTLASVISSGGSLVVNFSLSVEHDCFDDTFSEFYESKIKSLCIRWWSDPDQELDIPKNQIFSNNDQLLIDGKYSDFEFTVKETKFKVHKIILGPASKVFENLFANEIEESKTNKCKVDHLDPIAFGHMLKFIYSSKLTRKFGPEVAQGLFEVAHYYDLKELKDICEQEVLFGLDPCDAYEWYKCAYWNRVGPGWKELEESENQILSDNNQLLIDGKYSDFEFTVKETKFKVHKIILGAASEVFEKLFTSEMEESKTNKCEVVHLDPIAFGHMLKFVYSSELPEDFNAEVAQGLFEVAHYYDLKELKDICEEEVHNGLNADNALELFQLAQLYDLAELEDDAWEIVKRDVLKIDQPLKKEPLTLEEINGILKHQREESEYWKKILLSPPPTKRWKAAED